MRHTALTTEKMTSNVFFRTCFAVQRKSLLAVILFSLVINVLHLAVPLYLLQIFNRVLPSQSTDTLFFLTGIVLVSLITLSTLESFRRYIFVQFGTWLDKRLGKFVLSGSIARSIKKGRKSSSQGIRDLTTIRKLFAGSELFPIIDLPWTPIFIMVLFFLHPVIGLIALGGAICLFGLALFNELSTRDLIHEGNLSFTKSLKYTAALLHNSDVIEAMGMRHNVIQLWEQQHHEAIDIQTRSSNQSNRIVTIAKFFRMLLQIITIGAAGWLVLSHELSVGGLIASAFLMRRAVAPMDQAISSWKILVKARNAFDSVGKQLNYASELDSGKTLPIPCGDLKIRRVSFTYPKRSSPTLQNVTLTLHPGEIVGLAGETASGKSTLSRLLVGLAEPDSGSIEFGGIELSRWNADDRGPFIGYLPQNSQLFPGTLQQNIGRMGESQIEVVINAAKLAGVHDMIMQFPDGYATEIGEEGVYLSGGQRQRIALARAVYGEPKLLVLDEPETNLDRKGKRALAHVLKELQSKGSMIVLISHQQRMLDFSDYVLTLRKGRIDTPSIHQEPHAIDFNKSAHVDSSHVLNLESLKQVNQ